MYITQIHAQRVNDRYIKIYPYTIYAKGFIGNKTNELQIEDQSPEKALNYKVAPSTNFGAGFSYRWMALSGSLLKLNDVDPQQKGTTNQVDFQWNFYLRSITADIRIQHYEGYFLSNSNAIHNWQKTNSKLYQRDDLTTTSLGGTIRYNFNYNKYSARAVYAQTERQLKSAGSPTIGLRWNSVEAKSDSSFIPNNLTNNFEDLSLNQLSLEDLGIGGGYNYTYVHGNWFVNIGAMAFLVHQNVQYETNNNYGDEQKFQLNFQTYSAMGYANDHIHIGFTIISDQMYSNWKNNMNFLYTFSKTRFVIAKRFHLKPLVQKHEIWF